MEAMDYGTIAQDRPHEEVSNKYAFVPTAQVLDVMRDSNWKPIKVDEKGIRNEARRGFQKHVVRLRNDALEPIVVPSKKGFQKDDTIFPEVVLTNSHDRTSSFQIMAGLFRLVCSNGLIVADSMFASFRVKHVGYADEKIAQAVNHVMENIPRIAQRIGDFQISLSLEEQQAYASSALVAKYGDLDMEKMDATFSIDKLLAPMRREDLEPTLWGTYNVVQEKLIEQGGRFRKNVRSDGRRPRTLYKKAKAVTGVDENIRLNKALWALTERLHTIKTG